MPVDEIFHKPLDYCAGYEWLMTELVQQNQQNGFIMGSSGYTITRYHIANILYLVGLRTMPRAVFQKGSTSLLSPESQERDSLYLCTVLYVPIKILNCAVWSVRTIHSF